MGMSKKLTRPPKWPTKAPRDPGVAVSGDGVEVYALEHEEPGNLVGGPASSVAEPELASLRTGLGGDFVGVEPSLAALLLAVGAGRWAGAGAF